METLRTELAARSSNVLSLASSLSRAVPNAISVSFNPCARAALLDAAVLDIVDKLGRSAELLQSDRRVQSYDSVVDSSPRRGSRGTGGEEQVQPRWKRAHIKVSVASIVTRISKGDKGPEAPVEAGAVEVVVVDSRRTHEEAIIRRSSASESEPCTDSEPCTPQRDMGCDRANASLPRLPYCLARGSSVMSSTMCSMLTTTSQPAADRRSALNEMPSVLEPNVAHWAQRARGTTSQPATDSASEAAPQGLRDAALTEAARVREEARTEIAISRAEAEEEIAISRAEAEEDIAISRAEAADEIAISKADASEEIAISRAEAEEEIAISKAEASGEIAICRAEAEEERARVLVEIAEMMTEARANAQSHAARIKAEAVSMRMRGMVFLVEAESIKLKAQADAKIVISRSRAESM